MAQNAAKHGGGAGNRTRSRLPIYECDNCAFFNDTQRYFDSFCKPGEAHLIPLHSAEGNGVGDRPGTEAAQEPESTSLRALAAAFRDRDFGEASENGGERQGAAEYWVISPDKFDLAAAMARVLHETRAWPEWKRAAAHRDPVLGLGKGAGE